MVNGVSMNNTAYVGPKKKHTAAKVVAGTVATAALVTAGLAIGAKTNVFTKGLNKMATKNGKFAKFATSGFSKMNEFGNKILEFGSKIIEKFKGLKPFSK